MLYKNMGRQATDQVTGFQGIITGYAEYLTGCEQVLVVPKVGAYGTNTITDPKWFDVDRVVIEETSQKIELKHTSNGGDLQAPIK